MYDLFPVKGKTNLIVLTVHVNKAVLSMELDTGASLSLISENLFHDHLGTLQGFHARLTVDPTVQPRFFKPRPVP